MKDIDLSKIHDCEKCHGKMVLIGMDGLGNQTCGYCGQVVKYPRMKKEFNFISPAATYHRFMPGLQSVNTKMSSSKPESYIALTDDEKTVEKFIHSLLERIYRWRTKGIFLTVETQSNRQTIENLSLFFDKTIRIIE